MPKLLLRLSLLLALLPGVCPSAALEPAGLPEPAIQVSEQDGQLVLDIRYRVPVSPREAWSVLTDFENMAGFIPNLESSKVLQRSDRTLKIEQKGSVSLGMLPVHYESTRQIELIPYQSIRSHTLSGNTRLESLMLLSPDGKGTLLSYHATAVSGLPVPGSLVSASVSNMLEGQFQAMGREMLRRAQAENAAETEMAQPPPQTAPRQVAKRGPPASKKPAPQTKKRPG